ncbi:MAG: hypothetical protein ACQR33_01900 [Candidatus Saccharibacteria bacterium]
MAVAIAVAVLIVAVAVVAHVGNHSKNALRERHHTRTQAASTKRLTPAPTVVQPPVWKFPDGSRTVFPNYRLVALYGTPDAPGLGALGQQSLTDTITRVKDLASQYQPLSAQPIMPTLEIITTVASSSPTDNGDYSREVDPGTIQTWVTAAQQAGVYVVLDLQPGRTDFLTQAKEYAPILSQPNVGLALDPEWRLQPDQVPLVQIGSVDIHEVNDTVGWLADLTTQHNLPQKLLVLHEFRLSMLPNRDQLDVSHTNLAYLVQMDGQGVQSVKQDTWKSVTANPPANVRFGWKNFLVKDSPVLTPQQTMQIAPQPWYISYQ